MTQTMTNNPKLMNEQREGQVKRYVHQPLTIEHYGLHAAIKENGKVLITGAPVMNKETNELEYDEVEIPASLVFKLASLLKATRTIKFVSVTEGAVLAQSHDENEG